MKGIIRTNRPEVVDVAKRKELKVQVFKFHKEVSKSEEGKETKTTG